MCWALGCFSAYQLHGEQCYLPVVSIGVSRKTSLDTHLLEYWGKVTIPIASEDAEQRNHPSLLVGMLNGTTALESDLVVP